jgi:hypothetical protein
MASSTEQPIATCAVPMCGHEDTDNDHVLVPMCTNGHKMHWECLAAMLRSACQTKTRRSCPLCRDDYLERLKELEDSHKSFRVDNNHDDDDTTSSHASESIFNSASSVTSQNIDLGDAMSLIFGNGAGVSTALPVAQRRSFFLF